VSEIPAASVKMACFFFPKWLGAVCIGVYLALNAGKTLFPADDPSHVSVGKFIATLEVFKTISEDFAEIYQDLVELNLITDTLKGLTVYLNMATDLRTWKRVNRARREMTREARTQALAKIGGTTQQFLTDTIPIRLESFSFGYEGRQLFDNVNISVPQGKLVAVVGAHGSGKATLLQLLGHTIFPDESAGRIFMPTHLRILHVSQEPVLLNLTLWENLVFGCPETHDKIVVNKILQKFGMETTLAILKETSEHYQGEKHTYKIDVSDSDTEVTEKSEDDEPAEDTFLWQRRPMYTEKSKIHLARAFIMNPEIMILQRPMHHFSEAGEGVILDALQEHVRGR